MGVPLLAPPILHEVRFEGVPLLTRPWGWPVNTQLARIGSGERLPKPDLHSDDKGDTPKTGKEQEMGDTPIVLIPRSDLWVSPFLPSRSDLWVSPFLQGS